MGDYNADKFPDLPRMQIINRNYNFTANSPVLGDQWTIDPDNVVISSADGTKNIQVKIKYDPNDIPLT